MSNTNTVNKLNFIRPQSVAAETARMIDSALDAVQNTVTNARLINDRNGELTAAILNYFATQEDAGETDIFTYERLVTQAENALRDLVGLPRVPELPEVLRA